MTRRADAQLSRIIRAISDRHPVEWGTERSSSPHLAETLEALRMLDDVARVYRSLDRPIDLSQWGPLQIREKIGEGSFGEVFRAYDPNLQIEVALKLRRDGADNPVREEQMMQEARSLARLRHPNVLAVHGVDRHDERVGMWTDLVQGQTLEELIAAQGPLGATEAAVIGMDLCRALAALHAAGLVHGDVKTQNVVREHGGRIVLMDFGAVRELMPSGRVDPGEPAFGTPLAAAPEVLSGEPAGPAADLFSLGVLLYRLVTGSFPVEARTLESLRAKREAGEWIHLRDRRPDLPRGFVLAVERALETRPENRHASAGAFERSLADSLVDSDTAPRPAPAAGPRVAPAVRSVRNNLPTSTTTFVGRERERRECLRLLEKNRLLTLTGFGGCGKTRLALRVAEESMPSHPGGVWFVDLAPLDDPERLPFALASVLGVRQKHGQPLNQAVVKELRGKTCLVVLDNCEHLLQPSADLASWLLEKCPGIRILATSREPLHLKGEQSYRVAPLPLPETVTIARVVESDAVNLFVERARLVLPDFRVSDENASAVAGVCRTLDGIPLALELAAARIRVLSPEEILARLGSHLRLLSRDDPREAPRHSTLSAAFEWSYDLLSDSERTLLKSMTVFAGAWTLDAAVAISRQEEIEVLQTLTRLVDKSLISVERVGERWSAYRLLETVRQLASEKLTDPAELEALRERHATHYADQIERIEEGLAGSEQARWLARVQTEHENILAAIRWMSARPERVDGALELAGALWRYWHIRGNFALGWRVLSQALKSAGPEAAPRARAKALCVAAFLATFQGDSKAAGPMFAESLTLYRSLEDLKGIARALAGLGIVAGDQGDYVTARSYYEESLASYRKVWNDADVAIALNNLGAVTWRLGDYPTAAALHREGLELARRAHNQASAILNLINLAWIALRMNEPQHAQVWLIEVLRLSLDLGARLRAAEAMELAAEVLALRGEWGQSVRLSGAAAALRAAIDAPPEDIWRRPQIELRTRAQVALDGTTYRHELASGQVLEFEPAVGLALEWLEMA